MRTSVEVLEQTPQQFIIWSTQQDDSKRNKEKEETRENAQDNVTMINIVLAPLP